MTLRRRIAFTTAFLALTVLSASATLGLVRLATGDEPEQRRGAVAGAQKTIVPEARPPQRSETARGTVVTFLQALRSGDYARACDQLLNAAGCERGLIATNAGVTDFRLVTADVRGANAVVDAIADGKPTRFTLLRRSTRWWIATLDVGR